MSGDLAGTFVARRDLAVHLAVTELARGLVARFPEADLQRSQVTYLLDHRLPHAMGLCLSGPRPLDDAYRWHLEETAFPSALATTLGCEVWCLAHHGIAGGYAVRLYRPGSGLVRAHCTETPVAFLAPAKALLADLETLVHLLRGLSIGRGPTQSLADPSADFLAPLIAALDAEESAGYPGREDFKVWLPTAVVAELEGVARRTNTDVGIVYWCAWEWAKPRSFEAFSEVAGKRRKGPTAKPSGLLLPGSDEPPPALPDSKPAELRVWLPARVIKELNAVAELCERGSSWAFLTAYRCSRAQVLGSRVSEG